MVCKITSTKRHLRGSSLAEVLMAAGITGILVLVLVSISVLSGRSFAAFYLREGRVIAVDAINKPPEFMAGRKLIVERKTVDRARIADPAVPMRELA